MSYLRAYANLSMRFLVQLPRKQPIAYARSSITLTIWHTCLKSLFVRREEAEGHIPA